MVTSAGWQAAAVVEAVVRSSPVTLGTLVADATGAVSGMLAVPSSIEPGQHTLTLSGLSGAGAAMELSTTLTVSGPTATTTSSPLVVGSLARTGTNIMHAVWSGYWFIVAGSLLIVTALRRERLGRD